MRTRVYCITNLKGVFDIRRLFRIFDKSVHFTFLLLDSWDACGIMMYLFSSILPRPYWCVVNYNISRAWPTNMPIALGPCVQSCRRKITRNRLFAMYIFFNVIFLVTSKRYIWYNLFMTWTSLKLGEVIILSNLRARETNARSNVSVWPPLIRKTKLSFKVLRSSEKCFVMKMLSGENF